VTNSWVNHSSIESKGANSNSAKYESSDTQVHGAVRKGSIVFWQMIECRGIYACIFFLSLVIISSELL